MAYVPLEWLSDHVEVKKGTDAEQLAKDLVRVGLEEETILPPPVTGPLVVGKVISRIPEEQKNGKTINYCRVDVGEYNDQPGEGKEPSDIPSRSIVCGAHNFVEGDYVVVSLPGAILPGEFEIATRKVYGHISDGMICSAKELGLSEQSDGIILLKELLGEGNIPPVGSDLVKLLGLDEEILEINITPDRGYCFSMRGVAREYSHSTGAKFTDHGLATNLKKPLPKPNSKGYKVVIDDQMPLRGEAGCDRFVSRIVENIDPESETPKWMQNRLKAAGMRPISFIVDISNYAMLDLGQPNHIYDLDKLEDRITVRRAQNDEKIITLDDTEYLLHNEDLVICDGSHGQRIIGLAGVIGGTETQVTKDTKNVLIECAHFDHISIARTSRRHKISTQASKRFERGVDPLLADVAAEKIVQYLVEYGHGVVNEGVTDINNLKQQPLIAMRYDEAEKLVGVPYTKEQIDTVLTQIGCEIVEKSPEKVIVKPASWRSDIYCSACLIEEIARLIGYDKIPSTPVLAPAGTGLTKFQKSVKKVADTLSNAGLSEVLSYPFVGNVWDKMEIDLDDSRRKAIKLSNPLTDETPFLRTSILDSLIDVATRNVSRGNTDFGVYELGMVYDGTEVEFVNLPSADHKPDRQTIEALYKATPKQPTHVAGVLVDNICPTNVLSATRKYDWADAIDYAYRIGEILSVPLIAKQAEYKPYHPGRTAGIYVQKDDRQILVGYAGQLHPKILKKFNLPESTCAFEINLSTIIENISDLPIQIMPISTYPLAKEDIALVVDESVAVGPIIETIYECGNNLLESVKLFDIYRDEKIGAGKKSLTFALRMRSDHTITSGESNSLRKKIVKKTGKLFGASLRAI